MGKRLIIKGADFSDVSIDTTVEGYLTSSDLENNGIVVIQAQIDSNYGTYPPNGEPGSNTKRIRIKKGKLIPINYGQSITLSGLKGINGNLAALTMCIVIYSSKELPHHDTLIGGSNLNTPDTYFPENRTELADTYTWVNNIGSGYLSFCGLVGNNTSTAPVVDTSNYNIHYIVEW